MNIPYDVQELKPYYVNRKSFYNKAFTVEERGRKILYSYYTPVAEIYQGETVVYDTYSSTTLVHIKEFLNQNGFIATTKKHIEEEYILKEA